MELTIADLKPLLPRTRGRARRRGGLRGDGQRAGGGLRRARRPAGGPGGPGADGRGGGAGRDPDRAPAGEDPATDPIIDPRLADGSRVAVCSPPAAPATAITIRRFGGRAFTIDELTACGSLPAAVVQETAAVLGAERNVLISGATGSGKTTLLNALVSLLPAEGRVISIEDTLELRLRRSNGLRFEARGLAGRGVSIRDLVRHALRPPARSHRRRRGARRRGGRSPAGAQHRARRQSRHRARQQRRPRGVAVAAVFAGEDARVAGQLGEVVEPVEGVAVGRGGHGPPVVGADQRFRRPVRRAACASPRRGPLKPVRSAAAGWRRGSWTAFGPGPCAGPEAAAGAGVDLRAGPPPGPRMRRQVHEAAHRLVVGLRVGCGLQAGERGEDLGAVVEALAAGDAVADAGSPEGVLQRARLRVGALELEAGHPRRALQLRACAGHADAGEAAFLLDGRVAAGRGSDGAAVGQVLGVDT